MAAAGAATEPVISLQTETGEGGLTLEGCCPAAVWRTGWWSGLALRGALEELPQREREVLLLRYYKGLTQTRAARVLGVSQVQVSRLERRAVERLRQMLAPEGDRPRRTGDAPSIWTKRSPDAHSIRGSLHHLRSDGALTGQSVRTGRGPAQASARWR